MRSKLKRLREIANLTQEDMAAKLEMSVSGYNLIENGKRRMQLDVAKKISDIFGLTIEEIFFDDNFCDMQKTKHEDTAKAGD